MTAAAAQTESKTAPCQILLLGMPRSGTTWVAKIFDSDPDTLYRHEPDSYGRMNFLPLAPAATEAEDLKPRVREFFAELPRVRDTKIAASAPMFRKRYLSTLQEGWNLAAALGTKAASRYLGERAVPLWLPDPASGRYRLVVKSIESLARAGVLARALPDCHVVLLIRHPCGFVASMLRGKQQQAFADNASIGEDLRLLSLLAEAEGAPEAPSVDTLAAATPAERLAWQWVLTNDKALADTEALGNVTVQRYEDLCADPVGGTEPLFEASGMSVSEQTRRFLRRSAGGTHRERYYSVYKNPQRAANAWREELPADVIANLQPILAESRAAQLYRDDL